MTRIASTALRGAVCGTPAAVAADAIALEPRYNPALYAKLERSIDPDGSTYGLRFGASEGQLLEVLGVPNGAIVISATRKALRELRAGEHLISWEVAQPINGNPFFDRGDCTREASVELSFAGYSESGRRTGYKLIGFSILSYGP